MEQRLEVSQRFSGIVGNSAAMRHVFELIANVASTEATVLITGESGTGKELVARSLHDQSLRSTRPFVAINCGALTETLLESELFGHERGAFTGRRQQAPVGLFEEASGGTLFLERGRRADTQHAGASFASIARALHSLRSARITPARSMYG